MLLSIIWGLNDFFVRILNPKNWTRLGDKYQEGEIESVYQKPKMLLSQMTVIGAVLSFPHLLIDLFLIHDYLAALLDTLSIILMVVVYIINEKGYYFHARAIMFILVNILIFLFANFLPVERGVYLIFFAIISLTFPLFSQDHRGLLAFIFLPSILLIVTLILNFNAFDIAKIDGSYFITFVLNMVITTVLIIFSFGFLIRMNQQSQQILERLIKEWNSKNKELEKANAELDRFVYSTSHDLRSPLLSIKGLLNLIKTEESNKKKVEYLDHIEKSVYRQDEFITEILQYSRNTRLDLNPSEICVKDEIEYIVDECKLMGEGKEILFEIDVSPTYMVITDKLRFITIFKNIISNAVKYRDLRKQPKIVISAKSIKNVCSLSIKDNGIGISETYQDTIFDMFFRATENNSGSGLGLYIVKEMVEKLHGSISVNSTERIGSTFLVNIPEKL